MYLILRNASVLDASAPQRREGCDVIVEGDRIREVSPKPVAPSGATVVDLGGRTLMPGLIDCHVHATATMLDLGANARVPHTLLAYQAMPILKGMLARGFTTVRDVGGADHGLAVAIENGLIEGPRLFIAGRALSQTGGHADFRGRWDERDADGGAPRDQGGCAADQDHGFGRCRVADRSDPLSGVLDARAARDR
jgi:imidazolonepropionase-like amidohydrolase